MKDPKTVFLSLFCTHSEQIKEVQWKKTTSKMQFLLFFCTHSEQIKEVQWEIAGKTFQNVLPAIISNLEIIAGKIDGERQFCVPAIISEKR